MAYSWMVIGTVFNTRYGLLLSKKKQMASAMRPKKKFIRSLPALPHTYKNFAKKPLLREYLAKGISINSLNGVKYTPETTSSS